jgi:hypothetical protein
MPTGNHGQESQMSGTASLAIAIAVGCMVAGGGESTDWYTAGKAYAFPGRRPGAGQQGQLGKERTT